MYELSHYKALGSLITSNTTAFFDPSTGYAQFNSLSITKSGMYIILISVSTTGHEYKSQCYSNPIQIIKGSIPSYDKTTQPDYTLKFVGNYSSINPAEIKANVYNYFAMNGISLAGMSSYSGSVYITFYSLNRNTTLINALISNGLNISSSLTFSSINVDGSTYTCTNCIVTIINTNTNNNNNNNNSNTTNNTIFIINNNNAGGSSGGNSNLISTNSDSNKSVSVGAIVGGVIGGCSLIAFLIISFKYYQHTSKFSSLYLYI
jgi:hypothetical protein